MERTFWRKVLNSRSNGHALVGLLVGGKMKSACTVAPTEENMKLLAKKRREGWVVRMIDLFNIRHKHRPGQEHPDMTDADLQARLDMEDTWENVRADVEAGKGKDPLPGEGPDDNTLAVLADLTPGVPAPVSPSRRGKRQTK